MQNGSLYGTTGYGGTGGNSGSPCSSQCGTVFRLTPAGTETVLYSFCTLANCADGFDPQGLVIDKSGTLYGTTLGGGAYNGGTVFAVNSSTGSETVLYNFCSQTPNCADGDRPYGRLILAGTTLYGTGAGGGATNAGVVFKVTTGGVFHMLYSFCAKTNCADGKEPLAGLLINNGSLYGTTAAGGAYSANGGGTVFELSRAKGRWTETVLYSFCALANCADGEAPLGGLIADESGNLYGTTEAGGAQQGVSNCTACGTVFEISPGGTETVLYSFCAQTNCTDGRAPAAGLYRDRTGNLYGTTPDGGANCSACGTVFKLAPSGSETVLHSFDSQEDHFAESPLASVISVKGYLYGTAASGGIGGGGIVFKLGTSGGDKRGGVFTSR